MHTDTTKLYDIVAKGNESSPILYIKHHLTPTFTNLDKAVPANKGDHLFQYGVLEMLVVGVVLEMPHPRV